MDGVDEDQGSDAMSGLDDFGDGVDGAREVRGGGDGDQAGRGCELADQVIEIERGGV